MIFNSSKAIIAAGILLACSAVGSAQIYGNDPYYRNDPYGRNGRYGGNGRYGDYGRNGRYGGSDPAAIADRVARNISSMARYSYSDRHEQDHFGRAIQELQSFQDRWTRQGRFDSGNLDRAIDNMKHLAGARQLDPRARDTVARDIEVLRSLRANGGSYNGYRNRSGSYGYPGYPGYRY